MVPRLIISLVIFLALPGCYVKTSGLQTSGGGMNATAVSTQTVATTGFSNGRASFSFGQAVPSSAPGGQATYGRNGVLIIAAGLMVADFMQYVGALFQPGPSLASPAPRPSIPSIADTCSCYRDQPMSGEPLSGSLLR